MIRGIILTEPQHWIDRTVLMSATWDGTSDSVSFLNGRRRPT